MNNEKQLIHLSKFLSMVLRHKPETINITLDQNGWTNIDELLIKANTHGVILDRDLLNYIVETNPKKKVCN